MKHRFPLNDVKVTKVKSARKVVAPLYADNFWQMNQREFAMQVDGVGEFYACDGREVEYMQAAGADENAVELYLNGSVYGAILHQRKILPMHGSCFLYRGQGVMICGEAGAGKSSLTASFCINGAEFLTDDITPVIFKEDIPYIWAKSDRIKLWGDTFKQFGMQESGLSRVHPEVDKYYLPMSGGDGENHRLEYIFIIQNAEEEEVTFDELTATDKFVAVRSEVYRPEYLFGMPENVPIYFSQTVEICSHARVFRVKRPVNILVSVLHETILDCIGGFEGES